MDRAQRAPNLFSQCPTGGKTQNRRTEQMLALQGIMGEDAQIFLNKTGSGDQQVIGIKINRHPIWPEDHAALMQKAIRQMRDHQIAQFGTGGFCACLAFKHPRTMRRQQMIAQGHLFGISLVTDQPIRHRHRLHPWQAAGRLGHPRRAWQMVVQNRVG